MRLSTVLKLAAFAILLLIVALTQVVKSIDVNDYRQVLAKMAKSMTGRDLTIRGKVSLKMSLTPALVADDVELSNSSWGSRPVMVKVRRIEADISLLPLLTREVRVHRLVLIGPDVLLERDAQGRANWDFGQPAKLPPASFSAGGTPTNLKLRQLRIENAQFFYRDGRTGRVEGLHVDRMTAQADNTTAPVGVDAAGTWGGRHFDISGVLGTPSDLMAPGKTQPLKVKAVLPGLVASANGTVTADPSAGLTAALDITAEATEIAEAASLLGFDVPPLGAGRIALSLAGPLAAPRVTNLDATLGRRDAVTMNAKGSIGQLMSAKGLDLVLTAEGDNLAGFNKPLDLALPALGPVKVAAHLTDTDSGWRLGDIRAMLGRSDVSGEAVLRLAGLRPHIDARLVSTNLDLGQLTTTSTPAVQAKPAEGRILSDKPLRLSWLAAFDAELGWKIDRLLDDALVANRVDLTASLEDGRLTVAPAVGNLASGHLNGKLTVNVAGSTPGVAMTLGADRVNLGDVFKGLGITAGLRGAPTDLRFDLKGNGRSPREIMATLNGEGAVVVGRGAIEGANGDPLALAAMKQLDAWSHEKNTDMQCLVSRFTMADGMARSEALLLDTGEMTVAGQGSINFGTEELDLTLAPHAKETSSLGPAVPIDIGGSLAHPSVAPNKGVIVKGVSSAMGTGGPASLGSLAMFMNADGDDDNPCLAALAQAKKSQPLARAPSAPTGNTGKPKAKSRHTSMRRAGH